MTTNTVAETGGALIPIRKIGVAYCAQNSRLQVRASVSHSVSVCSDRDHVSLWNSVSKMQVDLAYFIAFRNHF